MILKQEFQNPSLLIKTEISYHSIPYLVVQFSSFTDLAHAWFSTKKVHSLAEYIILGYK
jgi:hypothetical protein